VKFKAGAGGPRITYDVWSEIAPLDEDALRNAGTYELVAEDYALLTEHDLLPETVEMVQDLTEDAQNVYDSARTIEAWLSGPDFLYSLNVPELPPTHPIDSFLNQVRRGHCQLFASAMALMLRSQGVPARLASGYRGGDYTESDQSYIVREQQAHVWVEALLPGFGWVIFDPSPPGDLSELAGLGRVQATMQKLALQAKMFWYQEVEGFDRGVQLGRLREFSLGFVRSLRELPSVATGNPDAPRKTRPIVPLVLLAMSFVLLFFLLGRRRRVPPCRLLTEDQVRAIELHRSLRKQLARQGIRLEGRTAEEIREELRRHRWESLQAGEDALDVYSASRFGTRPLPVPELADHKRRLRQLRLARAK